MKNIGRVSLSARAACVCHLFLNSLYHALHGRTARTFHQHSGTSLPATQDGLHCLFVALDLLCIRSEPLDITFTTGTDRQQPLNPQGPGMGADIAVQSQSAFAKLC